MSVFPAPKTAGRVLAVLVLAFGDLRPVQAQDPFTNGLVAYYPFNGNANDASGHGNDGTVNGAILTSDYCGNLNSAYAFVGTPSCKITVNSTNLLLQPPFSFTLWVDYTGGTQNPRFISTWGWGIALAWPGTTRPIDFFNGYPSGGSTAYYDLQSVGTFTQGIWHHVAAVRSTNTMLLYVDGQLQNTLTVSGPIDYDGGFGTTWLPTIGGTGGIGYPYDAFAGSITRVRIYSRDLSTAEVQQLYEYESVCACFPHRATATATVENGSVVGATMADAGCGYTNTPLVLIQGGGGTGAMATAVVSNGVVAEIVITAAGTGYTNTPTIYIYSPVGLQIGLLKAVKPSFSDLLVGNSYQLQVSGDLITWTNAGSPFTATAPVMTYPQYWDVDDWSRLFFRLQAAP